MKCPYCGNDMEETGSDFKGAGFSSPPKRSFRTIVQVQYTCPEQGIKITESKQITVLPAPENWEKPRQPERKGKKNGKREDIVSRGDEHEQDTELGEAGDTVPGEQGSNS